MRSFGGTDTEEREVRRKSHVHWLCVPKDLGEKENRFPLNLYSQPAIETEFRNNDEAQELVFDKFPRSHVRTSHVLKKLIYLLSYKRRALTRRMLTAFFNAALLASFLSPCHAYFSQGWQPGQPVTKYLTGTSTATAYDAISTGTVTAGGTPVGFRSWKDLKLGLEDILISGPFSSALMYFGFNVSEALASARESVPRFTHAIPLVTDGNYEDLIHNEELSLDGEKDRVWAILVWVLHFSGMNLRVLKYATIQYCGQPRPCIALF